MFSTVKNNAYSEHVMEIMTQGLRKGSFSDVVINVPSSKKVIKCHKSVLSRSSGFLKNLLSDHEVTDEPISIILADSDFDTAMAMMNLVYVGKIAVSNADMVNKTGEAAKSFLGISTVEEKIVKTTTVPSSSSSIIPPNINRKPKAAPPRIASKRPLLVKASDTSSQPLLFFLTPTSSERYDTTDNSKNVNLLNSYQKAKIRCADKFKCDICAKGFPLSCLLQRHLKTHFDEKPFKCTFCDKGFSSKTTLKHHLFKKHSEDRILKIEMKDESEVNRNKTSSNLINILSSQRYPDTTEEASKSVDNIEIIDVKVDDVTKQVEVQLAGDGADKAEGGRGVGGSVIVSPSGARARLQDTSKANEDLYYWI